METVSLESDARWELVKRIVASPHFQRSHQLRDFLLYVSEKAILNHPDEVNEQQVGQHVMGRRPDYDPNSDNIVRVQARQLRTRLQEYFETEGRAEPVIVQIPKGSYLPVFERRPPALAAARWKLPGFAVLLPWTVAALLAIVSIWLATRPPVTASPLLRRVPWSQLFDPQHVTTIVTADSCFALQQDIAQKTFGLKEYLNPGSLPKDGLAGVVAARQFTSVADLALATRLLKLSQPLEDRVQVRYARNLQVRDFKSGHFILFGSARSNPWVELFDKHRNFRAEFDDATRTPLIRNRKPQPGEQEVYNTSGSDGRTGETYAVVAFLPGQDRNGNVLIIEGTNMEGTEAAGDLILNPATLDRLLRLIAGGNPYFEVLLRSTALAGTARDTQIIATRSSE